MSAATFVALGRFGQHISISKFQSYNRLEDGRARARATRFSFERFNDVATFTVARMILFRIIMMLSDLNVQHEHLTLKQNDMIRNEAEAQTTTADKFNHVRLKSHRPNVN